MLDHLKNPRFDGPVTLLRRTRVRLSNALTQAFFGRAEEENSLMLFSSLGKLSCICHPQGKQEAQKDRRGSCRVCGHEILESTMADWSRELSPKEIRLMVKSLERVVARGRVVELPLLGVTEELTQFMDA